LVGFACTLLTTLKTAEQFAAVLEASKQKGSPDHGVWRSAHFALHRASLPVIATLLHHPAPADQPAMPNRIFIGVIAPKRWAKRAVTRNTIKRQVYAVSRELSAQLLPGAYVLRLASGFAREQFKSATSVVLKQAIRQELISLFGKVKGQPS
jgi:ribonuclease P protein component